MLSALAPPFTIMESAAGLTLKPVKCNLVPLIPFSDAVVHRIKRFLIEMLPQWKNFNIVPVAKYLGFFLGPAATAELCHEAPYNKYCERSKLIGTTSHASVPATVAYNRDAVSVTSYVTQLVAPPKTFCDMQYRMLASVLKIPFRALGNHAIFDLKEQWGLPAPFDLFTLSDAIAIRAATKTVTEWPRTRAIMADAFDRFAGIHHLPESYDPATATHRTSAWLSPQHWCMQPLAVRLHIAAALEIPVLQGRPATADKIRVLLDQTDKP